MLTFFPLQVNGTTPTPRVVGPSVVPTKVAALIAKWPTLPPTPNITTAADGTITIPAAAFTSKNKSACVSLRLLLLPALALFHLEQHASSGLMVSSVMADTATLHRSVSVMQSMDDGLQILHGGCSSSVGPPCVTPSSSSWTYTVPVSCRCMRSAVG